MGSIKVENGYWNRISAQEECSNSCSLNDIPIPWVRKSANVFLYGDEAYRKLEKSELFTYSLIGACQPHIDAINYEINSLKQSIYPDYDPDSWKIHMKILSSGQQRRKHAILCDWDIEKHNKLIEGMKSIFHQFDEKIFKYNITLCAESDSTNIKLADHIQREAYTLMLSIVIDDLTTVGGQPNLFFDSQKLSKANIIIHQWAEDTFSSLQRSLIYTFLSHSIFIPKPIFVVPASHPLLEVADFMSFIIARYHYKKSQRQTPEISLSNLGRVRYMTFLGDGNDLEMLPSEGFPWLLQYE